MSFLHHPFLKLVFDLFKPTVTACLHGSVKILFNSMKPLPPACNFKDIRTLEKSLVDASLDELVHTVSRPYYNTIFYIILVNDDRFLPT